MTYKLELAGGVPALHPERKGQLNKSPLKNWVEKHGGLPTYINSVATALLREHPEWGISRIIATAVNWAKKTCATGKAFGGKVQVSKAVQAAACTAVAQWEKKKTEASEDIDAALLQLAKDADWGEGNAAPTWVHLAEMRRDLREQGVKDIPNAIRLSDQLFFMAQYEIESSEDDWQGEGVIDLLDPQKFMELADNAAYGEALVRFPVMELAEPNKVGEDLYEKVIVRNAIVKDTRGNKVMLDGNFMKALKKNFDELAATGEYVPLQFVKDDNKHTDDPRYYGGEVVKMELDDEDSPTQLKATFKLGDEAKKVVDAQPRVGVSIGAQYFVDASGRPVNPFLKHIALAHRVQVKGMGNWKKMIDASEYGEALTLDLSESDVELLDTDDSPKGGTDMADTDNGKVELTEEMLQQILASDEVQNAINTKITEATDTLRNENETLKSRLGNVESKSFAQAVEAAVDSYANKGVPKVARDLVQGMLLTFASDDDNTAQIELSVVEGEGDNAKTSEVKLSRYEAAIRLLEEFEGFVNLSKEQGSNEEVELSDNGSLDGDDRSAASAFLTGKARANNQ
jgi:hypothetical protein